VIHKIKKTAQDMKGAYRVRCSSVVVGKGAIVRDCREVGRMVVMCKVGTIDYSVSGECGGGRDSRGKVKGQRGR
jgi:hypothetical protein